MPLRLFLLSLTATSSKPNPATSRTNSMPTYFHRCTTTHQHPITATLSSHHQTTLWPPPLLPPPNLQPDTQPTPPFWPCSSTVAYLVEIKGLYKYTNYYCKFEWQEQLIMGELCESSLVPKGSYGWLILASNHLLKKILNSVTKFVAHFGQ